MSTPPHRIEARIQRLERTNKLLVGVLLLLLVILTAGFKLHVAESGVIVKASRFEMVDADGRVRVRIGMAAGGPEIVMLDEDGDAVSSGP